MVVYSPICFQSSRLRIPYFFNNTALMGGAFYISNGDGEYGRDRTTSLIRKSEFHSNHATYGGAIYSL